MMSHLKGNIGNPTVVVIGATGGHPSSQDQSKILSLQSKSFFLYQNIWVFFPLNLCHWSQYRPLRNKILILKISYPFHVHLSTLFSMKRWQAKLRFYEKDTKFLQNLHLMPSPSASSKFVLSVLKFLGILKFLGYTQKILGILKSANLCSKI